MSGEIQRHQGNQIVGYTASGQPIVKVGERICIVKLEPLEAYQPAIYQPSQPPPTTYDRGFLELLKMLGIFLAACLIGAVVIRAFFPPVAGNQPIVIQPEKKPYYRKDCQPAGLFGWGQSCTEERGWQ